MAHLPWTQPLSGKTKTIVKDMTQVSPYDLVLDFGAGFGRYSDLFVELVKDIELVYTVEIDLKSVATLKEKGYKNIHIPNSTRLPYPDNFFDVVFSSNVLEHIPKKEYYEYLKEIKRVLKPGCRFMVGIPSYPFKRFFDIEKAIKTKNYRYYFFDDPTHINKMNFLTFERDLKQIFSEVKLNPTEILFERWIPFFKRNRFKFRFMADKLNGYCVK